MTLDLNSAWTDADVAKLFASVKDDRDWRLEVSKQGVAFFHDMTEPTDEEYDATLHCYFEMFQHGGDFVGPRAAKDKGLMGKFAQALRDNYPRLQAGPFVFVST